MTRLGDGHDIAKDEIVQHHEMMRAFWHRGTVPGDSLRNNIKIQGGGPFDVGEVVAEVVRISIEARLDFFRSVFHAQFTCAFERYVHFAIVQLQSARR